MSLQKSPSHRKATSSFVNDADEVNLIQLSPHMQPCRLEQCSPITKTSNLESKTNFIADRIFTNEIPRAFVVTKTGEKHSLDLDSHAITHSSSNPFNLNSPRFSAPTMERISEKSSSQLSLNLKLNKSSRKLNRKSKPSKRDTKKPRQKLRLGFTSRNVESSSSTRLFAADSNVDAKVFAKNTSTETQTDYKPHLSSSLYETKHLKPIASKASVNYIPMEGPRNNEYLQRQKSLYDSTPPTTLKPLKIYTKSNYNLRKYSELRSLASALTLITVIFWLFSTFFETEYLWDYLDSLRLYFQNWVLAKEKPKTKLEILVEFLKDLLA